jgi:hypothetical protein
VERAACAARGRLPAPIPLFEVREFGGVGLAVALGDNTELADAVAKLRAGPVLAP